MKKSKILLAWVLSFSMFCSLGTAVWAQETEGIIETEILESVQEESGLSEDLAGESEAEESEYETVETETTKDIVEEGETFEETETLLTEEVEILETVAEEYENSDAQAADNESPFTIDGTVLKKYTGSGGAVEIPDGITEIANRAFMNADGITSVVIPSSVEIIGSSAFENCKGLVTVTMNSGLVTIKSSAFTKCIALRKVRIPDTVVTIGASAFSKCTAMESIVLGSGLKTIGSYAFQDCDKLDNVIIPEGVTYLESYIFNSCDSLTNIELPDTVTTIGNYAFAYCSSLEIFNTGNGVTKIESYAFRNCTNLEELTISYFTSVIANDIVSGCDNVTLYVYEKSHGLEWAQQQGLNYVVMEFIPSPVTNLKAQAYSKKQTLITWDFSAGADGYLIYGQKDGKYGYVGMTEDHCFVDTKALDEDYNYYWVFPYTENQKGDKKPGKCTKYVYAKGVCPAVTNLKAAAVQGGVKLTWDASRGAEGYLIYGKTESGSYGYKGMTSSQTFTDRKASSSEYNFYWVFPYHKNSDGKMIVGGTPKYVYRKAK